MIEIPSRHSGMEPELRPFKSQLSVLILHATVAFLTPSAADLSRERFSARVLLASGRDWGAREWQGSAEGRNFRLPNVAASALDRWARLGPELGIPGERLASASMPFGTELRARNRRRCGWWKIASGGRGQAPAAQ